jgi:predicted DNA-binding transcriptional regulator AlpA
VSRSLLPILLADPARLADLPPEEATAALVELAAVQTALAARLHASAAQTTRASDREPADRLLKPDEAAECMGVTLRWLYRRVDKLPFARRLGRKTLRFSEAGMRRYMAETRG